MQGCTQAKAAVDTCVASQSVAYSAGGPVATDCCALITNEVISCAGVGTPTLDDVPGRTPTASSTFLYHALQAASDTGCSGIKRFHRVGCFQFLLVCIFSYTCLEQYGCTRFCWLPRLPPCNQPICCYCQSAVVLLVPPGAYIFTIWLSVACLALQAVLSAYVVCAPRARLRQSFFKKLRTLRSQQP
jgi:hypothetical protein